jgi:uncharacterized membrane protein YfcA
MNLFHPDTTTVLYIVASILIPFVTSLLSRAHWDGFVMGLISAALATVNGFVSTWQAAPNGSHYDWQAAVSFSVLSFLVAVVGGRVGLLKGTKLDAKLLAFPAGGKHEVA